MLIFYLKNKSKGLFTITSSRDLPFYCFDMTPTVHLAYYHNHHLLIIDKEMCEFTSQLKQDKQLINIFPPR